MRLATVVTALQQVTAGLMHLHRHGILHRDLRAVNVLVASFKPLRVLLADFGVSHLLSAYATAGATTAAGLTASGHGTVLSGGAAIFPWQWSAPEVRAGSADSGVAASVASDVYMLGGLLYEALTCGVPPYHWLAGSPELMEKRLRSAAPVRVRGVPVRLPGLLHLNVLEAAALDEEDIPWCFPREDEAVAEALKALMSSCLAYDPEARPTLANVAQTLQGLQGCSGGGTSPAPVAGTGTSTSTYPSAVGPASATLTPMV
jgi:serine/threonine protein kinase